MYIGIKILIGIGILIGMVIIWFVIPYSPLEHSFNKLVDDEIKTLLGEEEHVFTEERVQHLPEPIQKHLKLCGYMGKPIMKYTKVFCTRTAFGMGKNRPNLTIDYHYYNFTKRLKRYAYIKSQMFGIPFEGLDKYENRTGSMKGVIGKVFTLFDSRGDEMNQAALVTLLGEAVITPSWFLDERLDFQVISENEVKVTIQDGEIKGEGIYCFDKDGFITSLTTNDRYMDDGTGNPIRTPWTAEVSNYIQQGEYRLPTQVKATWHCKEEDYVYFNCDNVKITNF